MAKAKKPAASKTGPEQVKQTADRPVASDAKGDVEKAAAKSAASAASQTAGAKAQSATSGATSSVKAASDTPAKDTANAAAKGMTPEKSGVPPKAETPKPAASSAPVQHPRETSRAPQERRGGFLPLLLGGLVAGGIGFVAAQNDWFSEPDTTADRLGADIAANAERLTELESATVPEVDLSAIDTLAAQVEDLSATLADIDARLAVVEQRPAADGGPSIADQTAFEKELQALKASAEEQRAEIAALLNNAQSVEQATAAAAQTAQVQSAVSQITAALGTGQAFADTLATLTDSGVDVPTALSDVAADGVVTLTNLQSRFPDTARAALGVARSSGAMEGESGFGGFLKRQLGARSTQPREGSDPDAVLSRVEAAVRDGGLDTALTEIDTLPQDVQSAMQDWLDDARARSAAETATQDLSQSLPAN